MPRPNVWLGTCRCERTGFGEFFTMDQLPSQTSRKVHVALLMVPLALALLSYVPLDEMDAFWQIRGGEEIFLSHHVQLVDTWSSTAFGTPWVNFQWLFCLALYLFHRLTGGYYWFPALRALMVFGVFRGLGDLIVKTTPGNADRAVLKVLILLPLIFVVGWQPIELRADLACILVFIAALRLMLRLDLTFKRFAATAWALLIL